MDMDKRKRLQILWISTAVAAMVILIALQYFGFTEYNRIRAFREAEFLISETEKIIEENDMDRADLQSFIMTSNLEKARLAARMIDLQPSLEYDPEGLREFAKTIGVDQIHLFDPTGRLYSGTDEEYYGLTLQDGDQIRFFEPMLEDRSLSLCQDLSSNTKEGRVMLYSMCWNEAGTRMIQVGTDGDRFPRLLNRNRIDRFMALVPNEHARDFLLTDAGEDIIVAASSRSLIGKHLSDLGITPEEEPGAEKMDFETGFSDNPIYCSAKQHRDYVIYIAQYQKKLDATIPHTLFTFAEYLVLVFIAMSFVIDYYYDKFIQAKAYAMRDKLTNLLSRRAYEMEISEMENRRLHEDLVLISMDVNGLKTVNDTMGHQAGDRLLKGAADCISQCFSPYGKVFRFGGDEFAAIIQAKSVEIPPMQDYLRKLCAAWSKEQRIPMSISVGFAQSAVVPELKIQELEALADQEMYADKAEFYSQKEHDRRGASHESK